MSMTDPLGDMLTRIRNGQRAGKRAIVAPASKLHARVLDVLQREGFIRGYSEAVVVPGVRELKIELKSCRRRAGSSPTAKREKRTSAAKFCVRFFRRSNERCLASASIR